MAGVLIPTFGGIIKKANASAALQEATNTWKEAYALDLSDGVLNDKDNNGEATALSTTYKGYKVETQDGKSVAKYENVIKGYKVTFDGKDWKTIEYSEETKTETETESEPAGEENQPA